MEKKIVAAISGVLHYIKAEQEIACMQAMTLPQMPQTVEKEIPCISINTWGITGRQSIMQMRNMMQMKAFHKKY
ncbi:MAG: hypothetical protein HQK76_14625 [Desulfobacterales bacterium]|nr:hypothetical protein [Desulfobacterales bacterium]